MAVQLLYTPVLFSLLLFLTLAYAQKGPYDRFYFPSSYSKPTYCQDDTLLVRYSLAKSGPASFLALSLKCVTQTNDFKIPWALDLNDKNRPSSVVGIVGNIPLHNGTVPFKLPPLQDFQTIYGPAVCAFVLDGIIRSTSRAVTVQSTTILIDYDPSHRGLTYKSEPPDGQVPNGDYKIIDGNGTYDIKSRLSTGAKAGIGAGVGVGVIALLALGFFLWWRRRRQKAKVPPPAGAASTSEPGENKIHLNDEAGMGELHGNHVNELEGKHAHEIGPGVERVELGGDHAHHRFELP
ncbi:hypothetical protein QBC45DRAFT_16868 [Copromyces sp. CBS 386.78]|nr:hypothetical protein QBC45DRAFT_16868 [Copromyces sp. CBS 386.78]